MKIIARLFLTMLMISGSAYAWQFTYGRHLSEAPGTVTRRSAGFAADNIELNNACNKVCGKHNEYWTTQWKTSGFGSAHCECKVPEKTLFSLKRSKKKQHNETARSAGTLKSSEDLAHECPKICAAHKERYHGDWEHHRLGGYYCKCKVQA